MLAAVYALLRGKTPTTTHSLENLLKPRISVEGVVVVRKCTEKTPQLQPHTHLILLRESLFCLFEHIDYWKIVRALLLALATFRTAVHSCP